MLSMEAGGSWPGQGGAVTTARGLAGHRSVGGEQSPCASLALYMLFIVVVVVIISLYFISVIKLFLSQPMSFLPFTLWILSPIPPGGQ